MKKYLVTFYFIPMLVVAFAATTAETYDAVIEDDDETNAPTTSVTLAWDRNRETDIAGYNVYYGRASGDYTRLVTVTNPTAMIAVKGSKTLYFAVTAYDTDGLESEFSEEVHWP
jgi:fibronectin type 3 domain-containing protein